MKRNTYRNKQFVIWITTLIALGAVGGLLADYAGVRPFVAFVAGMIIALPLEYYIDWLLRWHHARQQVDAHDF